LDTRTILDFIATTQLESLADDYRALRERCGLVDRSQRGKLALTGPGAVEFLNGQVTNELLDLRPGQGRYAAFLTNKGKMLGDLRVLVVGGDDGEVSELLLDTERPALQALFDMIRHYRIGYDVELHKRTLERALYSLIGPHAAAVAARAADIPVTELPSEEHDHLGATIADTPDGLDVLCHAAAGEALAAALLDAGAEPVGEAAAEILRVERGRPRYGLDLDADTIPQEAGLNDRAVSFTKGCYVGQETVARLYYRGRPNRHLRGLRLAPRAGVETADAEPPPPEPGAELRLGERLVGRLGSVVLSPDLGPIGLALLRREATPGDVLAIGAHGATAEVVELPFRS